MGAIASVSAWMAWSRRSVLNSVNSLSSAANAVAVSSVGSAACTSSNPIPSTPLIRSSVASSSSRSPVKSCTTWSVVESVAIATTSDAVRRFSI